ncbi:MAG: hypothetical protein GOV00_02105 [Candidatus Altiarchaeota archaeon]|nr:hypothetical protein [Candidatus Altiarchaeota archaeon]
MSKRYEPQEFPVRCEVFSRVVGYIRPVNQWNDGKQEEFRQRRTFEKTTNGIGMTDENLEVQSKVVADGCKDRLSN